MRELSSIETISSIKKKFQGRLGHTHVSNAFLQCFFLFEESDIQCDPSGRNHKSLIEKVKIEKVLSRIDSDFISEIDQAFYKAKKNTNRFQSEVLRNSFIKKGILYLINKKGEGLEPFSQDEISFMKRSAGLY